MRWGRRRSSGEGDGGGDRIDKGNRVRDSDRFDDGSRNWYGDAGRANSANSGLLGVGGGYRSSDGGSDGHGERGDNRRCGRCSEGLSYRRNKRYSNCGRRSERGGGNRLRSGINGGLRHCQGGCERRHGTTASGHGGRSRRVVAQLRGGSSKNVHGRHYIEGCSQTSKHLRKIKSEVSSV